MSVADRMLNKYCMKTGLPFSEEMLKWDRGGMTDLENAFPGWQKTLNETTGFLKPQAASPKEELKLSEAAEQAIHDNMEYYNALYSYRISCWSYEYNQLSYTLYLYIFIHTRFTDISLGM